MKHDKEQKMHIKCVIDILSFFIFCTVTENHGICSSHKSVSSYTIIKLGSVRFLNPRLHQKYSKNCNFVKYDKCFMIENCILKCDLFLMKSWIFSIITPVFGVTWSFRNHSIMLTWCSINIYYFYQCWKWLCRLIFCGNRNEGFFFRILWWRERLRKKICIYVKYILLFYLYFIYFQLTLYISLLPL